MEVKALNVKKILLAASVAAAAVLYSLALFFAGVHFGAYRAETTARHDSPNRYLVREYNNSIAVFENGSEHPQRILDIDVDTLRKRDRDRFREGITVESLSGLAELEEDFSN